MLVKKIYELTKEMPKSERYNLTDQLKRAAISIPSNIAEGCSRNSSKEFSRYIQIALGSAFEVETQLLIVKDIDFAEIEDSLFENLNRFQKRLNALNKAIK